MFAEEFRDAALMQGSCGDGQHGIDEGLIRCSDLDAIHGKEHERGDGRRSLVAVEKRMVLYDMEDISCRHFEEVGVIIFCAASCWWHRKSRLKET